MNSIGLTCGFAITFQKETMSPLPPTLKPLTPEIVDNTVTLKWAAAVDDWNQAVWSQSPWNQATSIPTFSAFKATPSIPTTNYIVQYSSDISFSNPFTIKTTYQVDQNGLIYYDISGLNGGTTYYFRVCAIDDDGNPTNMDTWNEVTNPSGPHWSTVTMTKFIYPGAFQQKAVASTILNDSWPASNVIDGNDSTSWSSISKTLRIIAGRDIILHDTTPSSPEWIYLDLGVRSTFSCIRLFPRTINNLVYSFPVNFKFQYSDDAVTWSDIPGQSYTNYSKPSNCEQIFSLNSNINARYVRLYVTKSGKDNVNYYYVQIANFKVDIVPTASVGSKPVILSVMPSNWLDNEERNYCATGTPSISWDPNSVAIIRLESESSTTGTISIYDTTVNTAANSAIIDAVPDGNYVAFVKAVDIAGNSLWSDGRRITIDTIAPTLSSITETISGSDVKLSFTSSEAVSADVYWDMGVYPIIHQDYLLHDNTESTVLTIPGVYTDPTKPHYYRIEFKDKALNPYSTGTFQLGVGGTGGTGGAPGTNIVNTDRNFGLESYWDYQSIDLGRAGTAKVNLNNGNLVVAATDFSIPGRGIPLVMNRYYNSLLDYQGMLGKGWRTSFEMFLDISGSNVTIDDPDGSTHLYTYVSDLNFTRPKGDFRKVARNTADGSYTVTETNGTKYSFGPPQSNRCRLNSIVDRFGNTLTLNYDTNGYLISAVEPSGRITALFDYNFTDPTTGQKLLTGIRFTPLDQGASQSRYVTFLYQDGKGRLTDVRYPTEQMDGGQIVEAAVNYTYDSNFGLLSSSKVYLKDGNTEITGSRRNETVFGYKPTRRSIGAISTYYSYDGNTRNPVNYFFAYNGNSTVLTDPKGNQYTITHYGAGDPNGNNGQCQSVTAPICKKADDLTAAVPISTASYTYDNDYNMKTITQSKNVYDPVSGTDSLRNVITTYNFDSITGNLNSLTLDTGYRNATTSFTYETDSYHTGVLNDIKTITDAKGNITTYTNVYDSYGKLTNITITPPTTDPADPYTITHTFDQYGERTDKQVMVNGTSKYHFSYGYLNGLLSSLTNAFGSTTYYYTLYGERNGVIDANNVKTQNSIGMYSGNLLAQNAPGELSASKKFQNYSLTADSNRVRYSYDANGNLITKSDAQSNNTTYFYDELNQLIRVQSPYVAGLSQYNSYNLYDANGNLTDVTDYNSLHTTTVYDAANRKIQIKDNAGDIQQEIEYDESNRVKVLWDGKKTNHTVNYYDSLNNLLCTKYYDANSTLVNTIKYFKYDTNNNLVSYDLNGNLLTKSAPISTKAGDETGIITTDYQFDALNRVVSVNVTCATNDKYNQTTSYSYEAGQLKTMTVSESGGSPQTYTYSYDAAERLDYMTNTAGQKISFDYYDGGQRKDKYIYNQSTDSTPLITTSYTYDAAYLLRHLNYTWGSYYVKMGYDYNSIDKITSNPISYNINAPDVVSYLIGQQHNSTLSSATVAAALTNKSITDSYTYDNLGRMTSADIYGICPELSYNTSGSPVVLQRHQGLSFATIDYDGNPQAKTTTEYGTDTTTTNETDEHNYLNQMTSQAITGTKVYNVSFTYDNNGNKTAETYSGEQKPRTNSQFIYALDNQLLWSTTDSSHQMVNGTDCFNRTIKEYSYELSGKLLKASSDISDSTNSYDKWSANYSDYFYYSHDGVIAERHEDISKFKYFTRLGRELMACNTSDNGTYYYIQNLRGDVMMLVGSNGDISSIRDYDSTGRILTKAPDIRTDRDPFGFTGGLDAGNGMWKLGARFYDSSQSSFIQQDRYMGNPGDPLSLNRYVYCGLDPVNLVDPTGFEPIYLKNQAVCNTYGGVQAGYLRTTISTDCKTLNQNGTVTETRSYSDTTIFFYSIAGANAANDYNNGVNSSFNQLSGNFSGAISFFGGIASFISSLFGFTQSNINTDVSPDVQAGETITNTTTTTTVTAPSANGDTVLSQTNSSTTSIEDHRGTQNEGF